MKSDLDRLMAERDIDVAVITGKIHGNPIMYYMTNGARLTGGIVLKPQGRPPILACNPMERDEAALSGLETINLGDFNRRALVEEAGSALGGQVLLYEKLFSALDIKGRVAFYGLVDQGRSFAFLNELQAQLSGITVVSEFDRNIFALAQLTKDTQEIERMRDVGQRTTMAMQAAIDLIQRHRARDGVMVNEDGKPLTIGDVKREVLRKLFELGLIDAEGMIFSIGRDAGIPHSQGKDQDLLRLGESIVFDLYPCEAGGGYFHDMTRTFSLGYARPEVQEIYNQVQLCYDRVVDALRVNQLGRYYQDMTCDIFEEMGHQTPRTNPGVESGYVHSLGHGLGLEIHSHPFLGGDATNQDRLEPGSVFTIEPGLYFPERGYGVRLEDCWTVDADGRFHCLTDFPKELVIPVCE